MSCVDFEYFEYFEYLSDGFGPVDEIPLLDTHQLQVLCHELSPVCNFPTKWATKKRSLCAQSHSVHCLPPGFLLSTVERDSARLKTDNLSEPNSPKPAPRPRTDTWLAQLRSNDPGWTSQISHSVSLRELSIIAISQSHDVPPASENVFRLPR